MEKTVYIEYAGCNRRLLDTSNIENYLILNGYKIVPRPDKAKYIVLTTCAFKKTEQDYSMSRIRFLRAFNAKKIIYGCLPDIAFSEFKKYSDFYPISPRNIHRIDSFFEDISIKFSQVDKTNLIKYKNELAYFKNAVKKILVNFNPSQEFYYRVINSVKKIISNLEISTKPYYLFVCRGCYGECTYCAIRFAIGPCTSKSLQAIIKELQKGINHGYRNFIVLGDDVGCYGIDLNTSFPELLCRLLEEAYHLTQSLARGSKINHEISFHIKEIHAKWLIFYQKQILDIIKNSLIKSILVPIESGSNRILSLMKRGHTAEDILAVLRKLRNTNSEIEISTQIIVGFPSEKEEEFYATLKLVTEAEFDSVVIFPYHEKENTPASRLKQKIPEHIIAERVRIAQKYFRQKKIRAYLQCPD